MKLVITDEIPDYFHTYLSNVKGENLLNELVENTSETFTFFSSLTPEQWNHNYAPGKWTVKEILQHLTDCERVFAYRALCFSRFDDSSLPGFDEDAYSDHIDVSETPTEVLLAEFEATRMASIALFKSMTEKMLVYNGTANGTRYNALTCGYLMIGHPKHHIKVINERYL